MSQNVYRFSPRNGVMGSPGSPLHFMPHAFSTPTPSPQSNKSSPHNNNYHHKTPTDDRLGMDSPSPISPLVEPRRRYYSGSVRRPPSILNGLRDFVTRQRSESFGAGAKKMEKPMRKVQVAGCMLESVYDLREAEECGDFYDDEMAFRRPRSNSSDFLILRKTSRPLSVDVVGLVDAQSDPYRQYMKVVDCYELAPPAGTVVSVDRRLRVGKTFTALCENGVGAALVWDSEESKMVSIVTFSDFLLYLLKEEASEEELLDAVLSENQLVKLDSDTKIFDACGEFLLNRVHRIAVCEPATGDVLYLLTIKRVLQAIHKQNRSLHFAQWLTCPIRKSNVGVWGHDIRTVSTRDPLSAAVQQMLGFRVSSLPVVDDSGRAVDVIWKSDIALALRGRKDAREFFASCTISDALRFSHRLAAPFAREDDPVSKVLDLLLSTRHVRCAFVVNCKGEVSASVSLSDVLRHLLYTDDPFNHASPMKSDSVSSINTIREKKESTATLVGVPVAGDG